MASYKISGLVAQGTASADDLLYLVDTEDGGSTYASKSITVGNFLNGYATESFVSTQLDALVNGAPAALDTLKELSDALGADSNFSTTITNLINANEVHVDNMATLTGVAKDDTDLGTFTGSTIGDGVDVKAALQALETSLETKGSATLLNATTSDKNDLVALSGLAAGSSDLGSFTGSIISDDVTIKAALQELETEVARVDADISTQINAVDLSGIATNATNITALQADLASEVTARGTAVTSEATTRANADTALSGRLDTLEADPTTATALSTAISAEQLARSNSDTALSNRLGTLEADPTTGAALTAETTARTNADTALSGRLDTLEADPTTQTALDAEIGNRTAADTNLQTAITNLTNGQVTTNANNIASEATTRANADTALSGRLDTLEADPTTQTLLTAEATSRTSADTALSNRLDTLEADPTTQALLDAETAARTAADALLLPLAGGTMSGAVNFGQGAAATPTISLANSSSGSENVNGLEAAYPSSGGNGWQTYTADVSKERASGGVHYFEILLGGGGWSSTRAHLGITGTETNAEMGFGNSGYEPFYTASENKGTTIYNRPDYNNPDFDNGDVLGIRLDIDNDRIYYTVNGVADSDEAINTTATHYRPAVSFHNSGITFRFAAEDMEYMPAGVSAWASGGGAATVVAVDGTATFGGNVTASTAPTDDAHLVNKLYADNLVAGVDLSGIATNAAAISALTNGAPELLNTLNELAAAIGDDENFATTITGQISTEATTRGNADTALSDRLDTLEADPTTGTALQGEISTRASADTALSNRLDILEADPTTQTLLTAEATTRASADTALSGRLDTLEADPTTATAVTAAIATETAARQAADALLLPLAGGTMTGDIVMGGGAAGSVGQGEFEVTASHSALWQIFEGSGSMTSIAVENHLSSMGEVRYILVDGQQLDVSGSFDVFPGDEAFDQAYGPDNFADGEDSRTRIRKAAVFTFDTPVEVTQNVQFYGRRFKAEVFIGGAGGTAATIGADGTASFNGNITSAAVPAANDHLVNKLYADNLVAGVDLSGIATNTAAIAAETTARTTADAGLSTRLDTLEADPTTQTLLTAEATSRASGDSALSVRLDVLEADPTTATALAAEATARANAITALTNGAVAQNTAAIAAEVNTDRDAAITAAIAALTAGAVAQNAADILQEITDRQTAVAAEASARQTAVASLQSSITTTNANVSNNAQAITTEETARVAADAGKVDKASSVNVNLVGETSAASAPVDAQGADNFLFLVVDKATGAIKSIEKSFLEAE